MKLKQVIEAYAALNQLIESDRKNKFILSSAVRIKLAGNLRRVRPVYETFIEERNNLVRKYGEKKGDNFSVPPGSKNHKKFMDETADMLEAEVGDEAFLKIEEGELGAKPDIELLALLMAGESLAPEQKPQEAP